jgi:hypothetical protein
MSTQTDNGINVNDRILKSNSLDLTIIVDTTGVIMVSGLRF